jgi:SOS response regulatory protein OraA/RecX
MFKWLSIYFKTNKERSKKDHYNNGFDYAAGALLRKDRIVKELKTYLLQGNRFCAFDNPGDSELDSFDIGIVDAINKLKEIGFIKKDYMD